MIYFTQFAYSAKLSASVSASTVFRAVLSQIRNSRKNTKYERIVTLIFSNVSIVMLIKLVEQGDCRF